MKTLQYLLYEVTVKGEDAYALASYRELQAAAELKGELFGMPYPEWKRTTVLVAVPPELGQNMMDTVAKVALTRAVPTISKAFVESVVFKDQIAVVVTSEAELPVTSSKCGNQRKGYVCWRPVGHQGDHHDGHGRYWSSNDVPPAMTGGAGFCPAVSKDVMLCQLPPGHDGLHKDLLGKTWKSCASRRKAGGEPCILPQGHASHVHQGGPFTWYDEEGEVLTPMPDVKH